MNSWGEKDSWRASAYINGSPGADDSGIVPNPSAIVINEAMAHTDTYPNDWIELYNTTAIPIDISGWYLSDSDTNLMKYEFASGMPLERLSMGTVIWSCLRMSILAPLQATLANIYHLR
ncbi:MAG: lamin tail domain-containing protein [Planctomycetota bacterium]